jgi:hypothetical protein
MESEREIIAVKQRLVEEDRFQREKANIVQQLGGSPSELLTPSAPSSLRQKLDANVVHVSITTSEQPVFDERSTVRSNEEDSFDHLNETVPTSLDHSHEQRMYSNEEQGRRHRCINKRMDVFVFIILILLLIITVIAVIIATGVWMRNNQEKLTNNAVLCSLNRKMLIQCQSGFLDVPHCAMDMFHKMVVDYMPEQIDTDHANLLSYPCDATYFGLLTVAVAQVNLEEPIQDVMQYWTLATIYFSLGGPNWHSDKDWLTGKSPCHGPWYGITVSSCTEKQASIDTIDLIANNLIGSFPTELARLSSLKILNMNFGQITGTLPTEIGTMRNLSKLFLDDTEISGTIPTEIGLCHGMTELALKGYGIHLSGTIPTEIGLLSSLGMSAYGMIVYVAFSIAFV